ncbi:hypothetical protein F5148DRAFT_639427 [Russula earlei]|uniref:Uncharacterized protein n=1 Tax=Russula earlei TaxID=71964 RepID=A0ACC0UEG2_9AGAM|nr:hypothetical protein F5148DRAFT_639427 [Russula earlei]
MSVSVSPSQDATLDIHADPIPPLSGPSAVTKTEPQTPEPSPRASQDASWQPPQLDSPPTNDSLDQQQHHATPTRSPTEARLTAYGLRRSSLPVLTLIPPQEPLPTQLHSSMVSPHTTQAPPSHQNYHLATSFPSAVLPPHMLHHRRSTGALAEHPYSLPVRHPSATHPDYPPPSGPPPGLSPPHAAPYMRASISEGMDMPGFPTNRLSHSAGVGVHGLQLHHSARFHPFLSQSRRPNLAHRASVPAIFPTPNTHTEHLSAPLIPMSTFPPTSTGPISLEEQQCDVFAPPQQHDAFSWNNPDPFGAGAGAGTSPVAVAPDAGYSFGMPPAVASTAVVPPSGYEFPERKPSSAPSELDSEYTFTIDSGVYRRSAGSVVSLYGAASDTGTTTSNGSSAGPYFSDVTSEGHGVDEDGRRGSCVSTSEMLSRLRVGSGTAGEGTASPPAAGSDGYTSEHGTVTYPSPTSDCGRVNVSSVGVGISQSPIPHTSGSSELALALHSNESVSTLSACFPRLMWLVTYQLIMCDLQSPYTPPPAFKFSESDTHSPRQPQLPHEYVPYSVTTYGGGEYSHPRANRYSPSAYPSTFDGISRQ